MSDETTSSSDRRRRTRSPIAHLNGADGVGIATACSVLFVGSLIVLRRKPFFWYDELATRTLVTDPSLGHMVRAIAHGAENNPPLYELLLRSWAEVFGPSEFSLRLASTACFILAIAVMWISLRSAFRTRAVAVGVGAGLLGAQSVIDQSAEARFYGLFVLAAALGIACVVELARREDTPRWLLAATFLSQLLLVYSHLFGGIYSGAMLCALVVSDLAQQRFRPAAYGSFALAWLAFLPWVPATMQQALMAKPRNWIVVPGTADYFEIVGRQTLWLPTVIVGIAALAGIEHAITRNSSSSAALRREEPPRLKLVLLAVGVALIAVVPIMFVFSRVAIAVFVSRYLLPSSLGWTIVVAFLADAAASGSAAAPGTTAGPRLIGAAWCGIFLLTLTAPIAKALALPRTPRPAFEPPPPLKGLPVIVESAIDFWPMAHYDDTGRPTNYRFLLDREAAIDPKNARTAAAEYNLMQLYRREGYLGREVVDAAAFLCTTAKFFVLDRKEYNWFEQRIADDPGFTVAQMGVTNGGDTVRLVTRTAPDCVSSSR